MSCSKSHLFNEALSSGKVCTGEDNASGEKNNTVSKCPNSEIPQGIAQCDSIMRKAQQDDASLFDKEMISKIP